MSEAGRTDILELVRCCSFPKDKKRVGSGSKKIYINRLNVREG
jgi:hypothetical protein